MAIAGSREYGSSTDVRPGRPRQAGPMDGTTAPANRFVAALAAEEIASNMLAFCDMRTLYLRNVPDDVLERL